MTGKRVLVTGGLGYIGSHTVVELINQGYYVDIIDDLSNSKIEVLDGIEKITKVRPTFGLLDLCDYNRLDDFFYWNSDISAVIHFAAYKAVEESIRKPIKYYRNNIASLINLLELMNEYEIPNLVYSSSCTVYGEPNTLPITEKAPIQPANCPYGSTKQIAETMIKETAVATQLNSVALRYFNPIGAHDSALIGELPLGVPQNLVPVITQTAAGIIPEFDVYGDDYDTPDGSCIRDFIHVVDLAKAHIAALKRLETTRGNTGFETYNVGTGKGTSVFQAIKSFEKVTGKKLNYKIASRRPGDIEKIYADTKLANRKLKWKAKKSLDEAMLSAWNWQKRLAL